MRRVYTWLSLFREGNQVSINGVHALKVQNESSENLELTLRRHPQCLKRPRTHRIPHLAQVELTLLVRSQCNYALRNSLFEFHRRISSVPGSIALILEQCVHCSILRSGTGHRKRHSCGRGLWYEQGHIGTSTKTHGWPSWRRRMRAYACSLKLSPTYRRFCVSVESSKRKSLTQLSRVCPICYVQSLSMTTQKQECVLPYWTRS